jgi:hypothetical protein
MINFNFSITNPWSKRFSNLWCRSYGTPFEHKYVELEVYKDTSIVSIAVHLTARRDHSGLSIELGLVGYSFNFNFYDCRHWDYQTNKWAMYNKGKATNV